MLINRNNYEAIFLMYVDNELSTADRTMVEEFLTANEDLRPEIEILQATVLPGEELVFVPKTLLYKNETPVESVQESLLLLLDNELTGASQENLIKQINTEPQIKEEWSVLQKTVLDSNDIVIFENKKSLYRHTERVIPLNFWRAAAAVVIGLGLFTGITLFNDTNTDDGLVVTVKPAIKTGIKPTSNQSGQLLVESKTSSGEESNVRQDEADVNPAAQVSRDKILMASKQSIKRPDAVTKDKMSFAREDINLVKRDNNEVEKQTIQPRIDSREIVLNELPQKEEPDMTIINDADAGKTKNTFARLAVNAEEPDRFLNLEEDKISRSKLGGLFRQVKRVVERNTKIKTSNGLRIGGFEIAIK